MKKLIVKCRKSAYFIVSLSKQFKVRPFFDVISMMYHMILPVWGGDINKHYEIRHRLNLKFLKKNLTLPEEIPASSNISPNDYRIWVLWWQGEDNMPELVKATFSSIKQATDKEVVLVTEKNISMYIDIPEFISVKVKKGIITMAALSDYIRVSLLDKFGGLWIDSTVFFANPIPTDVYSSKFYSIRNISNSSQFVAKGKWNVQFLGTNEAHNRVFFLMKSLFEEYWKRYSLLVDYLLVDYCFGYIYENDKQCRSMFDSIPYTNKSMHLLRGMLNNPYNASTFQKLVNDDTYLFKLTYKIKLQKEIGGKETFYGHILKLGKKA